MLRPRIVLLFILYSLKFYETSPSIPETIWILLWSPALLYNMCLYDSQSIMWVVYNDEPTNGPVTFSMGHTKGTVMADNNSGLWLVHSVPKFPQLPYQNNNSYTYPKTGVKFGQSFLCMSMTAEELDKVGECTWHFALFIILYYVYYGLDGVTSHQILQTFNQSCRRPVDQQRRDGVRQSLWRRSESDVPGSVQRHFAAPDSRGEKRRSEVTASSVRRGIWAFVYFKEQTLWKR